MFDPLDLLSDAGVAEVVAASGASVSRNPHRSWFDPLDEILRADAGQLLRRHRQPPGPRAVGHRPGGARDHRPCAARGVVDGVPHLRAQLANGNIRLLLPTGRRVISQVRRTGLAELTRVGELPLCRSWGRLFAGSGGGVRWIGWSTNLHSSWGVTTAFKSELTRGSICPKIASGRTATRDLRLYYGQFGLPQNELSGHSSARSPMRRPAVGRTVR